MPDTNAKGQGEAPAVSQQGTNFDVGSKVTCQAGFDGQPHPAEILDKKLEKDLSLYYVHYLDCDKRLDEWVTVQKLSSYTLTPRASSQIQLSLPLMSGELLSPAGLEMQKVTRRLKRRFEEIHHVTGDDAGDHGHEKEHDDKNRVKNIQVIEYGRYEMETWYYSPYPPPYDLERKLYICEFTMKYFSKKYTLLRHQAKLDVRQPPGDEIYRSPTASSSSSSSAPSVNPSAVTNPPISLFEVDGRRAKVYCQNLCLLSKLFLDHKTLYFDVDPFLFYVLCEKDETGYHMVGYFSKEKNSLEDYNLACILTLPCYQRKGYGKLLIAFAYELSKREGRCGTPERPLSDLGQVSFKSYWTRVLLEHLRNLKGDISIEDISKATMIKPDDIATTLQSLGLIKYYRGTHLIHADPKVVLEHYAKYASQRAFEIEPTCLHWQPLVTQQSKKSKF